MESENSERPRQEEYWGDNIDQSKGEDVLRITTVNINGLPKNTTHPKYGILRESISLLNIDIIGLSELNIKWDRVYPTDRMKQRTASWWQNPTNCSYAYNYKDLSQSTYQPGGTAIISRNSAANRILPNSLSDPEGLGRWTSSLYNGKHNLKVRVIQFYCPALPSALANNSVYSQHHRYFHSKNITECPRKLFFLHLHQFVTERINLNEQLIVMGDINHSLDSPIVNQFVSSLNLHNIHQSLHSTFSPNIPTHDRGQKTIDAIFATPGLKAIKGGFLEFKRFPSDHRALWCDFSFHTLFGSLPPDITPAIKRRLQCEDPRIVNKFCKNYQKYIEQSNLHIKLTNLANSINGPLSPTQQSQYEAIDKKRVLFALKAEKKCRKFKMGGVEYSPKMQHQRDRISLWTAVLSKKKGNRVSTRLITRLEKRTNTSNTLQYSIQQIKTELTDAYAQYKAIKKNGNDTLLRDEWYEQLANAKAAANNTTFAVELRLKRQKEKQKRMFRAIKWTIKDKMINPIISEVEETVNNEEVLLTDKHQVEQAIIKANDKKYRQTNDTPLMSELLPDVGFLGIAPACTNILNGDYVPCQPIDPFTRAFLKELKRDPTLPPISTRYGAHDYATGWKKMSEYTTSGLSGIHFGHHKACATSTFLSNFESSMCEIPYRTGYSPRRYKQSVNAMLLKKQNEKKSRQITYHTPLGSRFQPSQQKDGKGPYVSS